MPSGFHRLLTQLDPDSVRARDRFEQLRAKLVRFFAWRGATCPEDEADETISRLAAKLELGVDVLDVEAFAQGIARLVLRESRRDRLRLLSLEGEEHPVAADPAPSDIETRARLLQRSLEVLPKASRELLLAYYSGGEGAQKIEARRRLALRWGLTPSTLRTRVQRLRERVEDELRILGEATAVRIPREASPKRQLYSVRAANGRELSRSSRATIRRTRTAFPPRPPSGPVAPSLGSVALVS